MVGALVALLVGTLMAKRNVTEWFWNTPVGYGLWWVFTFQFWRKDVSESAAVPVTPAPTGPIPGEPTDTPYVVLAAIIDGLVAVPGFSAIDRRLIRLKVALIDEWPHIKGVAGEVAQDVFAYADRALQALSIAATGRPVAQIAIESARYFLEKYWKVVFPVAQAALAAKGITV